jgi:hypothetical protein
MQIWDMYGSINNPALGKLIWEDCEYEASLEYIGSLGTEWIT